MVSTKLINENSNQIDTNVASDRIGAKASSQPDLKAMISVKVNTTETGITTNDPLSVRSQLLSVQQAAKQQVKVIDKLLMQNVAKDKKQGERVSPGKFQANLLPNAERFRTELVSFKDELQKPTKGVKLYD